jgi:O-antigen/teichoic acid export membrane protein
MNTSGTAAGHDTRRLGALRLAYHAGLYAGGAALLKLAGFVFFLWLARSLSVQEYATWGLLYALQTALSALGIAGVVESVVGLLRQHPGAEQRHKLFAAANGVFVITLAGAVALGIALFVVFMRASGVSFSAFCGATLSGALLAYASLQSQIVRLEERHLASLYFNFVMPLAGLIGSVAGFVLEHTVESFFWGTTLGLAIGAIGARLVGLGLHAFDRSREHRRALLSRIGPFVPIVFLGWLGGYGNNYVIDLFFDAEAVAKFTLAFMLSSIMQLIATALNQVWSPRFYRMTHELAPEQLERQNRRFFRVQGIALGLSGALLIALYPFAAQLLGGNLLHYRSLSLELALLVIAYVVLVPWWHCANYLLAYDKGPEMMKIHTATSAGGIVVQVASMLALGQVGIYFGFLAQMALRSAGILLFAKRHWPVRISFDGIAAGAALALLSFAFLHDGRWS